ncbi:hypothetical protein [uncultured Methanofollis sp.]|uniref:hypothetical protein n=1 Tax=uncultured Methanofollis sp. TaxID=262500 RepID=UPI0026125B18|nr:hypothetical protein [uncultured Methanofollis sp.]
MGQDLLKLGIGSAWAAAGCLLLVGLGSYAVTGRAEVLARYIFSLSVVAALIAVCSGLALAGRAYLRR